MNKRKWKTEVVYYNIDVVKEIKKEIEELDCEYIDHGDLGSYGVGCSSYVSLDKVLQIFNKHIEELRNE